MAECEPDIEVLWWYDWYVRVVRICVALLNSLLFKG